MSDTNTNGGPAFPASYYTDDGEFAKRDGMTLRDYYAAKAIAEVDWANTSVQNGTKWAYELADAMLKARGD